MVRLTTRAAVHASLRWARPAILTTASLSLPFTQIVETEAWRAHKFWMESRIAACLTGITRPCKIELSHQHCNNIDVPLREAHEKDRERMASANRLAGLWILIGSKLSDPLWGSDCFCCPLKRSENTLTSRASTSHFENHYATAASSQFPVLSGRYRPRNRHPYPFRCLSGQYNPAVGGRYQYVIKLCGGPKKWILESSHLHTVHIGASIEWESNAIWRSRTPRKTVWGESGDGSAPNSQRLIITMPLACYG